MTPKDVTKAIQQAAQSKGVVLGSSINTPQGSRCLNCLKVIKDEDAPPGYCCMDCRTAHLGELSDAKLRALVLVRDRGVCSDCGRDCLAIRDMADAFKAIGGHLWKAHVTLLDLSGFDPHAVMSGSALWEMAHIKARVQGGPNTIDNVRTACLPCHKKDTKDLSKKRAKARKGGFRRG